MDREFAYLVEIVRTLERYCAQIPDLENGFTIIFTKGLTVKYVLAKIKESQYNLINKFGSNEWIKILIEKLEFYE